MRPIQIGDVLADYKVIDIAGSGGEGAVYKIEHVITRRIEAMKLLAPASIGDPEQVRRFEREIQVQARLHHPNIVALYTAVRDGDSVALVMEFVEGESLQRILEAGPLSVETAVNFAGQVLGALAYAHAAGVIHRDVSPANIIVTPDGVAKLTDFGLARGAADVRLSASGVPVGSPWYMSPEQVRGDGAVDARTDIYAMGAVLHSMLTGGKLFEAEGAFAVMRAQVEAEPAAPSSRNPKVAPALDEIVRKAVAKDPAMRFQSADEFRLALKNAAAGPAAPVRFTLPRVRLRLRGVSLMRAAALVGLVPAALVVGFCTMRLFPPAPHAPASVIKAPAPPISIRQAPVAPQPDLVIPAGIELNLPGVPAPRSLARAPFLAPARAPQPATKVKPGSPIQVTGGEFQPAEALPAPAPPPPRPVEPAGPGLPKANAALPPAPAGATSDEPVPEAAAKPRSTGNRLAKALGKMNPFRKRAKHPGDETPPTPPGKN